MGKKFVELEVDNRFIEALNELNIVEATDIQEQTIPFLINENKSLIARAQTGTGKTAAFGLPLLHKINPSMNSLQAIVLCPTRELGQQIAKQLFKFTKYSEKIFTEAVYGGEKIEKQIKRLKRPTHIIVATPGRLMELIDKNIVNIEGVRYVVMDEADEMLSMGFKEDMYAILDKIPDSVIWLFSATMPDGVKSIIKKYMGGGSKTVISDINNTINQNISHQFVKCEQKQKLSILKQFVQIQADKRGIVFCRTKDAAKDLCNKLSGNGLQVDVIHGDLKQIERDKAMRAFKSKKTKILIATDITARGIDIKNLAYVVHYQLPDKLEYYVHRSGRTARAGSKGIALSIVSASEMQHLKKIEKELNISFNQTSY
jgi:ATP-dependent RNA helicase DeaD